MAHRCNPIFPRTLPCKSQTTVPKRPARERSNPGLWAGQWHGGSGRGSKPERGVQVVGSGAEGAQDAAPWKQLSPLPSTAVFLQRT